MPAQNNKALLNRKEWEFMTPAPTASLAGTFIVSDNSGNGNVSLYITTSVLQWLYHHDEDAFVQIPSGALAGTFGVGACGGYSRWGNTLTANGGSTTTATTATAISGRCSGKTVRFLSGLNAGLEATITSVLIVPGGTSRIEFAALPSAVANTDTFAINTGLFFIMNAGVTAAGIFKSYDPLTSTWTSLTTTNLPANWGTDGALVCMDATDAFATGTATAGAASSLTNSAKTWTVNQWTNSAVRITAGTGIGQTRVIASNTATVLTTATAWTTPPDATSQYTIEADEDKMYLLGNNAVTMYRYSRSANAWTVIAPTTARAAAPVLGMGANWIAKTGDALWADESNILDGRYIYSFRGTGALLDRFDIAGGTAGAGAWANIAYIGATEIFGSGSAFFDLGRYIYVRKDATNRFFKYSVRGNYLEPLSTNLYTDGAAVTGRKIWVKKYDTAGTIVWLYSLRNTGTELHRLPLF